VNQNPYNLQVDLMNRGRRRRRPRGFGLRAFTFDYTKQRQRVNRNGYPVPVGPLPSGGSVVGSKVALYGTSPDLATTLLSQVAKGEALAYPTQDGQWQKAAEASTQSFLVYSDLTPAT